VAVISYHSQYAATEYPIALHALSLRPGYVGEAADHSAIAWSYLFGDAALVPNLSLRFISGGT